MLLDPSADDMMEDCHQIPLNSCGLNFTCFRKKKKMIQKNGLLATRKQIIGRGFVFGSKVAGMFSYSVLFVFFPQTLCILHEYLFCTCRYAFPNV